MVAQTHKLAPKYFLCSSDWLMHSEQGYFACSLMSGLNVGATTLSSRYNPTICESLLIFQIYFFILTDDLLQICTEICDHLNRFAFQSLFVEQDICEIYVTLRPCRIYKVMFEKSSTTWL